MPPLVRLVLVFMLLASMAPLSSARAQPAGPRVSQAVRQALAASGQARVLITLRDPVPTTAGQHDREAAMAAAQDAVVAQLPGTEFTLLYRYRGVSGLAAIITPRTLEILQTDTSVISIEVDEAGGAHLRISVPAIRADIVHAPLGVLGQGVTAAVLDTGLDIHDTELNIHRSAVLHPVGLPAGEDQHGLRPDGSILFFLGAGGTAVGTLANLASFRPYASGVSLAAEFVASAPNFYSTPRTSNDLRGGYVFFVLVVKAGPLSGGTLPPDRLLGLATAAFSYP